MKTKLTVLLGVLVVVLAMCGLYGCGGDSDTETKVDETPTPTETGTLADNGIITTESGLQYVEIEQGDGIEVKTGDFVTVHYTGTLEDGTKFDSSLDRDQPLSFTVGAGEMIPGFDEGVAMMNEGGKAKLIIPSELGYGEMGSSSGSVPPNATITFEVELLSIDRPEPPQEVDEEDYQMMDNGVKYYDLQAGDGTIPEMGKTAVIHFVAWEDTGIKMQDSYEMGQPGLIPMQEGLESGGIIEGISTMNVGGKRQLVIPPEIAFGDAGDLVNLNPTLIIEVELLDVIDTPEPAEQTKVTEGDYSTTESGLKFYDLQSGEGASPEAGQFLAVHYTGWLTDGTKFDSSIDRGVPLGFNFGMGQMIRGFDEGVASMKVGGKRQLVIPPELGYGEQDKGIIPPNSTLIFEVELVYVYQQ